MNATLADLRHGFWVLLRNPGFAAVAILTLALGIGATTAIFGVVDKVLLHPLPFHEPDRLVFVWGRLTGIGLIRDQNGISPPEFNDLRTQARLFDDVAAYDSGSLNLTGEGEPERIETASVTASFFSTLGVQAVMGRTFMADEDRPGNSNVVVMSAELWRRRFAADPGIVGRRLRLDGVSYSVIGVMPTGFELFHPADLWRPIAFTSDQLSQNQRGSHYLNVIARLRKGASLTEMQTDLDRIAADLLRENPDFYHVESGWGIRGGWLSTELTYVTRPAVLLLAGAVSLLLWVACANVANLLLARGTVRNREMAIRGALGAGRARLVRQLLSESDVIALAAGALGNVLAFWCGAALARVLPALPGIQIDGRALGFAFVISILTSVFFGILPAFEVSRWNEASQRVAGGRRAHRIRDMVAVSEIALSLVLLAAAGLLIKSFFRLQSVDPGFRASGVLTMSLVLPEARYASHHDAVMFYRRVLENIRTIPGVDAAGFVSLLPLGGRGSSGCIDVESHPSDPSKKCPEADRRPVTSDYFRAMGIGLVRGRYFDARDEAEETPGVAIVDETLAEQFWPGEDPIGKRIKNGHSSSGRPWLEVVGVVRHIRNRDLSAASRIQIYWPYSQDPWPFAALVARTSLSDPKTLVRPLERAIQKADPEMPVYAVRTMEEVVARSVAQRMTTMVLLLAFSTMAVILAAVGIYGVLAYGVAQRSREIGIRIAVGARTADVIGLVGSEAVRLAFAGIVLGVLAALGLTRFAAALLFGVSSSDVGVYLTSALIVAVCVIIASVVPVRRAASVDPISALRQD